MAGNGPTLPPEILDRIVRDLNPQDIAFVRLASSALFTAASPYLIPCVTVAHRLETIKHLREVLEHPYFSRHVTTLIWDASVNCYDHANSSSMYIEQCQKTFRHPGDRTSDDSCAAADALFENVNAIDSLGEDGKSTRPPLHYGSTNTWSYNVELVDGSDAMKWLPSFPTYNLRWRAQQEMQGLDIGAFLAAKAPRLSKNIFTDYRSLRRPWRLFGDVLSPAPNERSMSDTVGHFRHMLRFGTELGTKITRLTVRSTGWQHDADACHCTFDIGDPRQPSSMGKEILASLTTSNIDYLNGDFTHLTTLDLALTDLQGHQASRSTANAHELLVRCVNLETPRLTVSGLTRRDDVNDVVRPTVRAEEVFKTMLRPLTFASLVDLDLRGWVFDVNDLQTFLAQHATTLRRVTLINNVAFWSLDDLASWAEAELHLKHLEVDTRACR